LAILLAHFLLHGCSGSPGRPTLSLAVHDPHLLPGLNESLPKRALPDHAALVCLSLLAKAQTGWWHKPSHRFVTLAFALIQHLVLMVQVVKKGRVQLQNRLVPDGPVHEWVRRIDDLQPDIDRVLQVCLPVTVKTNCNNSCFCCSFCCLTCEA